MKFFKREKMTISTLFQFLDPSFYQGRENVVIQNLVYDSKKVKAGDVFVALKGTHFNGHDFVPEVLLKGAYAVVQEGEYSLKEQVFMVPDTRKALALLSKAYFDSPDKHLKVVGITGTNGKTTSTYMIASLLKAQKIKMGIIGTIQAVVGEKTFKIENTTPESFEIYRLLALMKQEGCQGAVLEISSHALEMSRVEGLDLDAVIFTNLTQDHLDFHKNMENYLSSKLKIFNLLKLSTKERKMAFINADLKETQVLKDSLAHLDLPYETFGFSNQSNWTAYSSSMTITHNVFTISYGSCDYEIDTPLLGEFNLYNALGSVATSVFLGAKKEGIETGLKNLVVPGRFEPVFNSLGFSVIVDYAHTPDALNNVLLTALSLYPKNLICVFGAGGDRDKTKRPLMGAISAQHSHYTFITSDNPRTENPSIILKEIENGFKENKNYEIVEDREEAIKKAIYKAQKGDLILIAGKGHEDYQIFKDKTIYFSDKEVAQKYLKEKEKEKAFLSANSL